MQSNKIIIIGAGPCGLGAAWRLNELGYDSIEIYESSSSVGGLALSPQDENGFTWDLGGHVLHSHYAYFDNVFDQIMQGQYYKINRNAWIFMEKTMIPYPLQLNIHHLPKKTYLECLLGYESVIHSQPSHAKNYAEWLITSFGKGLATHFHIPYAKKVWATDPKNMSSVWVGDRVALTNVEKLIKRVQKHKDDREWGPNHSFKYPKIGGSGDFWLKVGQKLQNRNLFHFGKKLVKINLDEKIACFSDGTKTNYGLMLSTIPLDTLTNLISGLELNVDLKFSTVYLVGIGMKGPIPANLKELLWCYFPEKSYPFFRVSIPSNFSKAMTPNDTWSLLCEISSTKDTKYSQNQLISSVKKSLRECGFTGLKNDIIDEWFHSIYRGYPIPTISRDDQVKKITSFLEPYDIYPRGRFGIWKYEVSNQDHTFMQGVEWVNRVILGKPEITISNPNRVNNPSYYESTK